MSTPTYWCWHPTATHPKGVVTEENYRCCCGSCTAKTGLTIFIALDIVVLVFALLGVLCSLLSLFFILLSVLFAPLLIFEFPLTIAMVVLAILALRTLRPVYMQIYGVIYLISVVCRLFFLGFLVFFFNLAGLVVGRAHTKHEEKKTKHDAIVTLVAVLVVGSLIVLLLTLWRCKVTWEFYKYIRDRQLAIEQQPPTAMTYVNRVV